MPFVPSAWIDMSPLPDGRRWVTREPLLYVWEPADGAAGRTVAVPAGFVTDMASVPWLFRRLVPVWGKYGPAAVVHDRLYETHEVDRATADQIFLDAMRDLGVARWRRSVMYLAVRCCGDRPYERSKQEIAA